MKHFFDWFRQQSHEGQLEAELRFHLEQQTKDNLAAGMSPEAARREASMALGGLDQIKEACRDERPGAWLGQFAQDVSFGLRILRKNPTFTTIAVLSLALAIGAATSAFWMFDTVFLASLPVPMPQDLRVVAWSGSETHFAWQFAIDDLVVPGRKAGKSFSKDAFFALRQQCADQADLIAYAPMEGTARTKGKPVHIDGRMVSGNFFTGLEVKPELGSLLNLADESAAAEPRVVISHRWWVREFGGDPNAIGQQVNINGRSYAIAGVLPPEFTGVNPGWRADVFVCLSPTLPFNPDMPAAMGNMPGGYWLALMGRLRPGTTDAQLQAKLNAALQTAVGAFIAEPSGVLLDGRSGTVSGRSQLRQKLNIVSAVIGVVLLVACVNIAALLVARGHARLFELSLRGALGAGRGRLVRQLLTESLLLSILGGGLGIVFAFWGRFVVARMIISRLPEGVHYSGWPGLKVLAFALVVTLFSVLLAGLLPAWRVTFVEPLPGLRDRSGTSTRRLRTGKILVAIQISLSLLLITGAGLYARTLVNLYQVDPGFATDHLLQFTLDPHALGANVPRAVEYCENVEHGLVEIPGVQSATLVSFVPAGSFGWEQFTLPSHPGDGKPINVSVQFVGDGCFQTLRIPVLEGRELGAEDREGSPKVVVVNEAFAHRFLSDRPALGSTINDAGFAWRVVGICRNAKLHEIREEIEPTIFFPFRQRAAGSSSFAAYFAMRTLVPPLSLVAQVESIATGIDADVPATNLYTQEELRDQGLAIERASVKYYGSLAAFVLLLSSMGLYGLTSFEVSRRTTEFGIRLALGASRAQIIRPILRTAFLLAASGLGLGIPLALSLTRFASANLYGVKANDPLTFLGSAVLLSLVVLFASWIPARRATRVDPLVALRVE